jgi:hypothetical protein
LVVRYTAVSCAAVVLSLAAAWYATRRPTHQVVPGDRAVAGLSDVLARPTPDDAPRVPLRDVAADAGVACDNFEGVRSRVLPEDMASGCAWVDVDGDGDLDLFVVRMEPVDPTKRKPSRRSGHALFRNDGPGRFADVSAATGVDAPVHGEGVAPADYDGDGDLDLYVTCYGPNQLLRNRGDGTFEDVAASAGVEEPGFSTGAAWADYDGDGDLDLYVTNYVKFIDDPALRGRTSSQYGQQVPFSMNPSAYSPGGGRLFRNRGDGGFEDVTNEAGVQNALGRGLSVAFTDLDGDLRPDIYVANDVSDNVCYWNVGGGRFKNVSHYSGTADYRGAMGLGVGDFDNDSDSDLFITHWIAQENALYEQLPSPGGGDDLGPLYRDVADRVGLGAIALDFVGWGCAFFDYDLDGRLDLFVVNGHTLEIPGSVTDLAPQRPLLFWNGGSRGFFDMARDAGPDLGRAIVGRGAAFGDYDGDGDEDVYVVVHGGPGMLLRNERTTPHHWLAIRVRQGGMNRFALGARVEVTAGGRTQVRSVGAQPSYLSGNALDVVFGLGAALDVERVEVTFPDGVSVERRSVPADRLLVIERDGPAPK